MNIPKNLEVYLDSLPPTKREERLSLFYFALDLAEKHGLQSPQFWATRQIITGRNPGQIKHEINRRIRRQTSN